MSFFSSHLVLVLYHTFCGLSSTFFLLPVVYSVRLGGVLVQGTFPAISFCFPSGHRAGLCSGTAIGRGLVRTPARTFCFSLAFCIYYSTGFLICQAFFLFFLKFLGRFSGPSVALASALTGRPQPLCDYNIPHSGAVVKRKSFVKMHKNFPGYTTRQKPRACQASTVGARPSVKGVSCQKK